MNNQLPPAEMKVVKQVGDVKVHTFISPSMFLTNATHIIEGPKELILIDGQFVVPFAMGFRGYADSLGKPINRVYLSHEHVDHWFGISAAFGDVPIYALPETIAFLEANGEAIRKDRQAVFGPFVPDKVVIPSHTAKPGKEVIDGITFDVVVHTDAEVSTQLAVILPDLGIYVTQDLIYSGVHMYIHKNIDGWVKNLEALKASSYELFLPGHGEPADKKVIQAISII